MKAAEAAQAAARKALATETAKRDGMNGQITERKNQQVAAAKAITDIKAQITKLQAEDKTLAAPIADADKALPAAKTALDAATTRANSLPKEINFWKAAFFHVEVVAEMRTLDEMVLNQTEKPTIEERATLERQKMKVAALEAHHTSMLSQ
jgi:chromosome segregation ATPase